MFKKQELKFRKSFTLIEVLISVTVLTLVVGAMFTVELMNLKIADTSGHQLEATGLARSALNLVKSIRDENILTSSDTFTGIEKKTDASGNNIPQYLNLNSSGKWELNTTPATSSFATETLDEHPGGTEDRDGNPIPAYSGTTYTIEITVEE